jgi:hypothetical protein
MEFNLEDILVLSADEKEGFDIDPTNNPANPDADFDKDDSDKESNKDGDDDNENDNNSDDLNLPVFTDEEDRDETNEPDQNLVGVFESLKESKALVVPEDFEFDGTAEGLSTAIESTFDSLRSSAQESLYNALDEDSRLALKYALVNKKPLYSYYQENDTANFDYDAFDLEEEADQAEIMKVYLSKTTSLNETKINKQVDLYKNSGQLMVEAKDAYTELVAIQEEEKQKIEAELDKKQKDNLRTALEVKQKRVEAINKLGDVEESRRKKLVAFVANDLYLNGRNQSPTTEINHYIQSIARNPEHLAQLANLLVDYDPEKGIVLDRIVAKLSTKKAEDIKNKLDTKSGLPKGAQTRKKVEEEFNWGEWAKQFN